MRIPWDKIPPALSEVGNAREAVAFLIEKHIMNVWPKIQSLLVLNEDLRIREDWVVVRKYLSLNFATRKAEMIKMKRDI